MKKISLLFIMIFSGTLLLNAQINPEQVKEKVLDNGLKVVVIEMHQSPFAAVNITYRVGSTNDIEEGTTGMAHFLEHMCLKGTRNISSRELLEYYQLHGGKVTNVIARTGKYLTSLNMNMPSNMVEFMLMFEADRMENLSFEGFDKEKNVILSEQKRNESSLPKRLHAYTLDKGFAGDPYHYPVIGQVEDIQNMNLDTLTEFYHKYYEPSNATLCIVGDVEPEYVFTLADKYFGSIKNESLYKSEPEMNVALNKGEIRTELDLDDKYSSLEIGYKKPINKDIQPVFEILDKYLMKKISDNEKVAEVISNTGDIDISKIFSYVIIPKAPQDIDAIEKDMIELFEKLKLSDEEIKNIYDELLSDYYREFSEYEKISYLFGKYDVLFGDGSYFVDYPENISSVDEEEIRNTVKKYFVEQNRIITKIF